MRIKGARTLTSLLLVLSMTLTATMVFADDGAGHRERLTSQIDYRFVGHLEQRDDEGRLLVWQGTIDGDIKGEMKWWFVMPSPVSGNGEYKGGSVSFYSARWEIWTGDKLLLAGESAGKTVFPHGADGMWDGHGVVTKASRGLMGGKKSNAFKRLKGRKVYETGTVILGDQPPVTYSGRGMFVIY